MKIGEFVVGFNYKRLGVINLSGEVEEGFKNIIHNYQYLEESIVKQLYFQAKHGTTIGTFREAVWKSLFEQIIPKKFIIEQSVFIVDSNGKVSKEVDLAIIDEMYTPYIFRQGHLKFVPIEAVAVAIECKSTHSEADALERWTDSIKKLNTSDKGIARMHSYFVNGPTGEKSTQTSTRPLLIYCHLDGALKSAEKYFDMKIHAQKDKKIELSINKEVKKLETMYQQLNHKTSSTSMVKEQLGNQSFDSFRIGSGKEEVTLLSLNLILNQILMLINNPMLFPHAAYAKLFQAEFENIKGE